MGPDTIILRTGLLTEGRKQFSPAAEIFGKDMLSWEKKVAPADHVFDVLPPS